MRDISIFGSGAALLQPLSGTNKMNPISANSKLFTEAELRPSTLMRKRKAIIYTLTEKDNLTLGSKHPTVHSTDHKPTTFSITPKSSPNHIIDFN